MTPQKRKHAQAKSCGRGRPAYHSPAPRPVPPVQTCSECRHNHTRRTCKSCHKPLCWYCGPCRCQHATKPSFGKKRMNRRPNTCPRVSQSPHALRCNFGSRPIPREMQPSKNGKPKCWEFPSHWLENDEVPRDKEEKKYLVELDLLKTKEDKDFVPMDKDDKEKSSSPPRASQSQEDSDGWDTLSFGSQDDWSDSEEMTMYFANDGEEDKKEEDFVRSSRICDMDFLVRETEKHEAYCKAILGRIPTPYELALIPPREQPDCVIVSDDDAEEETKNEKPNTLFPQDIASQFSDSCVMCLDTTPTTAFVPCGHLCACDNCANTWFKKKKTCPLCRRKTKLLCRIYGPSV